METPLRRADSCYALWTRAVGKWGRAIERRRELWRGYGAVVAMVSGRRRGTLLVERGGDVRDFHRRRRFGRLPLSGDFIGMSQRPDGSTLRWGTTGYAGGRQIILTI